jgi:hypothetical protein
MNYYMRMPEFHAVGSVAPSSLSPSPHKSMSPTALSGLEFKSPQTVLKTAGLLSAAVHQSPLEFDR